MRLHCKCTIYVCEIVNSILYALWHKARSEKSDRVLIKTKRVSGEQRKYRKWNKTAQVFLQKVGFHSCIFCWFDLNSMGYIYDQESTVEWMCDCCCRLCNDAAAAATAAADLCYYFNYKETPCSRCTHLVICNFNSIQFSSVK